MQTQPFVRLGADNQRVVHHHPYHNLSDLECHIAPPYAIINAGPKCVGLDLDQITRICCQTETSQSQEELKHRLELLRDIWALIEAEKEAAKAWEEREREERRKLKRKRDEDETDTSSMTTKRTTRSQSHSMNGRHGDQPGPSRPGSHASKGQSAGSSTHKQPKRGSTIRKRKRRNSSNGATLTEAALSHLSKRKRTANLNMTVQRWVGSTYG